VQQPINRMVRATCRLPWCAVAIARRARRRDRDPAASFNDLIESLASRSSWRTGPAAGVKGEQGEGAAFGEAVGDPGRSWPGGLAAGIAHELNAVDGDNHHSPGTEQGPPGAGVRRSADEREANRAAIIRAAAHFSRSRAGAERPRRVSTSLDKVLELLKVEIQNSGVEVRVSLPPDLAKVTGNDAQLMQVFVNLVLNALQAMPHGGALSIVADEVARRDLPHPDLPANGPMLVRIAVRDAGTGIAPQDVSRVFDPFFTTKPQGKGSGLGLSVSMGIVRGFGGTILVESDGASWTEFTVLLPAAEEPAMLETV
jgi:signal transduction histidine kinase